MFKLDNQINSQVKLFLYFLNKNQSNYPLLIEHKKYLYQCLYQYREDKFYYFLAFLNPNCYIGYYDTIFKNTIHRKLEENQDIKDFINVFANYKFDRFCKFKYLLDKEILFLNYLLETMIIAIVLATAYYYMHKAQSDKRQFALYTAIISAIIASNMAFFLVGSYSFSKQEIKYLEKHHYHQAQIIEKQVPVMELEDEIKPDCLEKAKLFII